MDAYCSQFYTTVFSQPKGRQEVLTNLEESMGENIRQYWDKNGVPPKRVIFYRDGVAHNQFVEVAQQEIGQIRIA